MSGKTAPPLDLSVERLDDQGRGVAHRDGKVVFVEGALPGETVVAQPLRSKPSFDIARVIAVTRPSWQRAAPRCPHFGFGPGSCGGCALQHLEPRSQVAYKQAALLETFWRIGKVRPERLLPPIYGPFWGYRQRARLSVRYVPRKGGVLVGFHERHSSYVADMRECHILPPKVARLLPALRDLIAALAARDRLPQIEVADCLKGRAALVFRHLDPLCGSDLERLAGFGREHAVDIWLQPGGPDTAHPLDPAAADALALELPEFGARIPFRPTDFTQVNHALNEVMVSRAVRLLDPRPEHRVVDFFCGLGNFTLALARRARLVLGIEGSESLVARARAAASANRLSSAAEFIARDLFTWTLSDWERLNDRGGPVDRVLLDPPREGALEVCRALAAAPHCPERMVYVSCNPATLARDVAVLHHEGGWSLAAAGVMNMFPHTAHVESMALLLRAGEGR